MISGNLRTRANNCKLAENDYEFGWVARTAIDLLAAIDAHECPVSGGVPDELMEWANNFLQDGDAFICHADQENTTNFEQLLALADAKPTSWVEGPPKESEEGWVIIDSDGSIEVDYFHVRQFHNKSEETITQEKWRQTFRPDCRMVRGQITFPPPPKREPVVNHKEGCEWEDTGLNLHRTLSFLGSSVGRPAVVCPGCAVPLPSLEK